MINSGFAFSNSTCWTNSSNFVAQGFSQKTCFPAFIAAVAMGIAVDDTIHLLTRVRHEFERLGDYAAAEPLLEPPARRA